MKRRLFSTLLVLLLVASMTLVVSAATPRIPKVDISLCFEGTTAQCSLGVYEDHLTDSISATIKLYRGNTCIRTWVRSASGFLNFYEEVPAVKNAEYTLEAVITINGVTEPTFTITNTCD